MNKTCPYCLLDKNYEKYQQYAHHISHCNENPNFNPEAIKEKKAFNRGGLMKEFEVSCHSCKNVLVVSEREKLFPIKKKYFCNRACANRRIHSKETKSKISQSTIKAKYPYLLTEKQRKRNPKISKYIKVLVYKNTRIQYMKCESCSKTFAWKWKKKSCSEKCLSSTRSRGVKQSIAKRSTERVKRSKNEIRFANLCIDYFGKEVLLNKPMFNSWDADIIIPSLKIAILWNGAWHYKQCNKKHSVSQVQNRDKIKLKEIENYGYSAYTIKDLTYPYQGERFVKEQFDIFLKHVGAQRSDKESPKF